MQGHSSDKTRPRSRALVPVSRSLQPASLRLRGVELDGAAVPEAPRKSTFGLGLKIFGGVAALCAVALAGANLLAPSSWVEARAVSWVKANTGRDLAINGATRLFFLPTPHIEMTEAVISAPHAAPDAPALAISKLEIDLGFLELIGSPTSVERVVFDQPVLSLHADSDPADGASAQFSLQRVVGDVASQTSGAEAQFAIDEVLIRDGTVLLHSARRSKPHRFERVNAALSMPSLAAPMAGSGRLNWKGKAVGFDFELASPALIANQGSAQLELGIDVDTVAARYEGNIVTSPRVSGEGTLSAKTHSVRQFFAWLKGVSGAVPVTGDGEMTSTIAWNSEQVTLGDIVFEQENARGKGHANIALDNARPRIEGSFIVDDLDLGPILTVAGRGQLTGSRATTPLAAVASGPANRNVDKVAVPTGPAPQIEQEIAPPPEPYDAAGGPRLLKPGPGVVQPSLTISMPQAAIDQVLGTASASSASSASPEPFFDADVDLDIREAKLDGMRIGPSAVSVAFTNGTLKATLWHMSFYGGSGRGTLTAAVTDAVPSFAGDLRLEDVDTRSLLKDTFGLDRFGGQGRLSLNVSGIGGDWDAMALSLMGNGAFAIADGAVDGMAASTLVHGLEAGTLDLRQEPGAVMPFSLLAGSFDINHGLASTRNLRLRSASANINADGVVNLPRESLDLIVNPGPVEKKQGGGVASTAEHLPPLRIAGPLSQPRIGIVGNPLVAESGKAATEIVIPGIVMREKRGVRRRTQLTGGAPAGTANTRPSALAPSFSVAPGDSDGSPPLRMESLR